MTVSLDGDPPYRFRGWELIPAQRLLVVRGVPVSVGARAYDMLLVLAARRMQVVSKDELLAAVWPGRVVEENNISVHIASLRKLLGPGAIATVQGIGYRLMAEPQPPPVAALATDARSAPSAGGRSLQPLFGRDADAFAVLAATARSALVSITGPGGVGKTSLARHVVELPALQARGAARWIDLSPLRPGDALTRAVAAAIGAACEVPSELLAALSRTQALIVLDNCEHMAAEVAGLVGPALEAASDVRWIVTSQAPLHLAGEHVHQLQPLKVPAPEDTFTDAVRTGALALLRERAAAGYRPFELTPANVGVAIEICRELDGLPLAIEMAASRVATLGLDAVREQLSQKLRLSSRDPGQPERQRTLACTLDWSYELLTPDEQRVFRHLEPFAGGFTARMARQMVGTGADGDAQAWEALEALSMLVERSLVHRLPAGGRYFMFESAREYARERQRDAGESERVRRRHAEVMAAVFASARSDLERMRDADWSSKYLADRHNLRVALAWSCQARESDLLARIAAGLAQIDTFCRSEAEILRFELPLDTLLAASAGWRGPACLELSWAHFLDGHRKTATMLARQAVEDFRSLGDIGGAYQGLAQLARLYESRPGLTAQALEAAQALSEIDEEQVPLRSRLFRAITAGLQYAGDRTVERLHELHELARRSGYDTLAAVCRVHITDQLLIDGRFAEIVDAVHQFEVDREPRPRVRATIQANLVLALIRLGRVAEAASPAREVVRTLPHITYHVVAAFALVAVRQGNFHDAALMMGYVDRVRRDRDQRADPAEAAAETEIADALAAALPAARLAELRRLGSALSLEDAWSFIP